MEKKNFLRVRNTIAVGSFLLFLPLTPTNAAITVTQISAGIQHTLFLKSDGSLWGMGLNDFGQLGDSTSSNRLYPVLIVPSNVVAIAAGQDHSLFLKSDHSLWGMGLNIDGELGDGTGTNQYQPVQIVSGGVTAIAAGAYHSLFLKTNALWGMGWNMWGQLGNNSSNNVLTAVQLRSGGVASISCGRVYSAFATTDGSLWTMGGNFYGQLGDGDTSGATRFTPVEILTNHSVFTGVIGVAAGDSHGLFMQIAPGAIISLWGFGDNFSGDLGDGTTTMRYRPVEVLTSGVSAIAGGGYHSLVLKSDGSLWAMGQNLYGQLGDGGTTEQHTPEQIVPSDVTAVSAGTYHSVFILSDGSLWGMGLNNKGQLGVGSLVESYTPVRIIPPRQLVITNTIITGADLQLSGLNDFGRGSVIVLMSTNITIPISSWRPIWTNGILTGNFSFTATNAVDPQSPQRFYGLQLLQIQ